MTRAWSRPSQFAPLAQQQDRHARTTSQKVKDRVQPHPFKAETRSTPLRSRTARPWNGRDFYISFGEGGTRNWDDAVKYGFVSGGGKKWFWQSLSALKPGHRVFVHIPQRGYVGVGRVVESVQPVRSFMVTTPTGVRPILEVGDLRTPDLGRAADDPDKSEHLVRVEWIQTHGRDEAFWEAGFFANQNTAAKFRDTNTLRRLEQHFGLAEEKE